MHVVRLAGDREPHQRQRGFRDSGPQRLAVRARRCRRTRGVFARSGRAIRRASPRNRTSGAASRRRERVARQRGRSSDRALSRRSAGESCAARFYTRLSELNHMCGIAGLVVAPGAAPPTVELGRAMNAMIRHRGPDDDGIFCDARALLGMRRLSIIDVAGGHQPMHNADGTVQCVFNGEIYNYRELRAELVARGHTFYSQSDSEVIVQAYEAWGAECFQRLHGMFAIALWDTRTKTLLLARDRYGEKPLYVADLGDRLLFGSELKSLLQVPGFRSELDHGALQGYVTFGYVPSPLCILKGVTKLKPGHYLRYVDGRTSVHAYYTLDFTPKTSLDESEATEELARLLDQAVSSRLVSDVPFGAFLSGGLDSSVVVALMARHMSQPVKTFSIGFREAEFNEIEDARRVARHLGTEHHDLIVEPDAVALLEQLVWYLDEPFADASALPTYLVAQLARQHVKMALSGDGGDEAFAGY